MPDPSPKASPTAPRFVPDRELYPFASHWQDLGDGNRVHYLDEGKGPVLLLLHGNPAWSFLYRKIITQLSRSFRCVAPDLPGFGLSVASPGFGFTAREHSDAIIDLIDRLDLKGATVMVQDWGGPIGLRAVQARPDRIDRLIIGNTWAWPFDRRGPRMFSALMGGLPGRVAAFGFNGVVRFFFRKGVANPLPRQALQMYLAPFRKRSARRPTHIFPRELTAAEPFLREVERGLAAISDKPALILWGDRDFAFREHERARFRALFADHRDITLHGAGHFIQEDAPDAICKAIEAWFSVPPLPETPGTAR
ncbi:alpha/beta fold hydrolase [Roseibium aggregatum]|uniref:Alpha/beta fold hydrolase n=1 Tax=Roseibium aggregatum TaxID=187304 RepID=A0A926P1N0_9HYPH|nr:alpha/beta fold hydrolase [Roseibium aggregatum]MBD1549644.1 alpha/beta fold hydrolase [Roseibium aggregatum]